MTVWILVVSAGVWSGHYHYPSKAECLEAKAEMIITDDVDYVLCRPKKAEK